MLPSDSWRAELKPLGADGLRLVGLELVTKDPEPAAARLLGPVEWDAPVEEPGPPELLPFEEVPEFSPDELERLIPERLLEPKPEEPELPVPLAVDEWEMAEPRPELPVPLELDV